MALTSRGAATSALTVLVVNSYSLVDGVLKNKISIVKTLFIHASGADPDVQSLSLMPEGVRRLERGFWVRVMCRNCFIVPQKRGCVFGD